MKLLAAGCCLLWTTALLAQQPGVRATTEDGRRILIYPDGTWKPVDPPKPTMGVIGPKPPGATQKIAFPQGDGALWVNPSKWKETSREGNRVMLSHSNGKLFGMILAEGVGGVPTSSMRQVALVNAQRQDPKARIVSDASEEVSGRSVLYIRLDATVRDIPFSFGGYYHGGVKSNLQVLAYTSASEFAGLESEVREFLRGTQIEEASTPPRPPDPPAAPATISFSKFSLVVPAEWRVNKEEEGVYFLSHRAGDLYLKFIGESIQIPLARLKEIVLSNLRKEAKEAEVIEESPVDLDGKPGLRLGIKAAPQGIPLRYLVHIYGGPSGTLQLTGYSGENLMDQKRPLIEALVKGLKIQ